MKLKMLVVAVSIIALPAHIFLPPHVESNQREADRVREMVEKSPVLLSLITHP